MDCFALCDDRGIHHSLGASALAQGNASSTGSGKLDRRQLCFKEFNCRASVLGFDW